MITSTDLLLPPSKEMGELNVMHLKRYWQKSMLKRSGKWGDGADTEFQLDKTLLFSLGLGLEQTTQYLYMKAPAFEQFEQWIVETAGVPLPENVARFNKIITGNDETGSATISEVLSDEQLAFFDENGYVILRKAIPKEDCERTIETICNFIGIDRYKPETWYNQHPARQGIMVQLFQHPDLERNRSSEYISAAYQQLWNRADLWVSADRVGFNPPQTDRWHFPGPRLHWDSTPVLSMPFDLQGILYLNDVVENQGAFSAVPGFHKRMDEWLNSLPPSADPQRQDLYALGCIPIAANAGDFIIWHHALPHGSSVNTSKLPRYVQYFTYRPAL
jgi:ectoine hydroxylase-related dioxygenase (phytanoyl-CoA dioxygenase family)